MLGPLPPFVQILNFLPESERQQLLDWVTKNPGMFSAAKVSSENRVDPTKRICAASRQLGPLEPILRKRLLEALPELISSTGTGLTPHSIELELAAHGNGAFFSAHTDTFVGTGRKRLAVEPGDERVLSAVYYFHDEPRIFSGGLLRLYRFGTPPAGHGSDAADHITLDPLGNSLVAFPSTVLHEVTPVLCPSNRFSDQRFALNCWYCRAR